MNKRGDVTITILVIGVFLLGAFALLSFFMSDFKLSNSFSSISVMEKANAEIDEYLFYKNQGISVSELEGSFEIKDDRNMIFLHNEKLSANYFGLRENKLLFSVDYPVG